MTLAHADLRDEVFAPIADRVFAAAVVAAEAGIVTAVEAAAEAAEEVGLTVELRRSEASCVQPGDEILSLRGTPKQIALGEERIVGILAKPSGIATAARRFIERAAGHPLIVSGAWKKLPFSQKDMIRSAIVAAGAQPRIATPPFVYLDKNFVRMLGGVEPTLAAVAHLEDHRKVIQLDDPADAPAAARAGADIVFVDTGRLEDVAIASRELREAGLRDRVELAFGGGVQLQHIEVLKRTDVDIVDVGRAIVDAPLLDMRIEVRAG